VVTADPGQFGAFDLSLECLVLLAEDTVFSLFFSRLQQSVAACVVGGGGCSFGVRHGWQDHQIYFRDALTTAGRKACLHRRPTNRTD
jgi:hypothetical protein